MLKQTEIVNRRSNARTSDAADRRRPSTLLTLHAHAHVPSGPPTAIVQSITSSPGTVAVATVQSVLVHAHPGDGAAVGGAEEPHGRLRVPGRRGGTPTPVPASN